MKKRIIAVFGGSFNPPLNSHFEIAKKVCEEFKNVEKIIFVPVSTNYTKAELIKNEYRYEMLKLGCQNQPNFEVSDIELKNEKKPYTIDTLDYIKEQYKGYDIYFIVGTDNLKELDTWHEAEKLVEKYKFFVVERNNDKFEDIIEKNIFLKNHKNSFILLKNIERIPLSSSQIRKMIKNGEDVNGYLPESILKYIEKKFLYKQMN